MGEILEVTNKVTEALRARLPTLLRQMVPLAVTLLVYKPLAMKYGFTLFKPRRD